MFGKLRRMTVIGNRIAKARVEAGYSSQQKFAKALGVSRGLVGQWESHDKKPGRDNFAKIAALCGVQMEWLQGTSPTMRSRQSAKNDLEDLLLLAFRRMTDIGQQRLVELLTKGFEARRELELEEEPTKE